MTSACWSSTCCHTPRTAAHQHCCRGLSGRRQRAARCVFVCGGHVAEQALQHNMTLVDLGCSVGWCDCLSSVHTDYARRASVQILTLACVVTHTHTAHIHCLPRCCGRCLRRPSLTAQVTPLAATASAVAATWVHPHPPLPPQQGLRQALIDTGGRRLPRGTAQRCGCCARRRRRSQRRRQQSRRVPQSVLLRWPGRLQHAVSRRRTSSSQASRWMLLSCRSSF